MQTYLSNIIPSLKKYSKKLDNLVFITDKYWLVIDEVNNYKTSYYFRENRDVLINTNGTVKKGKWDYISADSILIEVSEDIYIFRHGFLDDNIFVLRLDNTDHYIYLINENFRDNTINTIAAVDDFLEKEYLKPTQQIDYSISRNTSSATNELYISKIDEEERKFQDKFSKVLLTIALALLSILVLAIVLTV